MSLTASPESERTTGRRDRPVVDIFVSYSHTDADIASRVVSKLRSHGFRVFIDDDIRTGGNFFTDLERAIEAAQAVVLIWSHAAKQSNFVANEMLAALDRGVLLPVAIDDAPISLWLKSMRVRKLVVNGQWDERAFQHLRRDAGIMCGRPESTNFGGAGRSAPNSRHTGVRSPWSAGPVRRDDKVDRPGFGLDPPADSSKAVLRALSAVHKPGAWTLADTPGRIRTRCQRQLGSRGLDRAVGVVDLALPGSSDAALVLWASKLELLITGQPHAEISYEGLVANPVLVEESRFGYETTIRVGGETLLRVKGKSQTSLALDVLHIVKEELSWLER